MYGTNQKSLDKVLKLRIYVNAPSKLISPRDTILYRRQCRSLRTETQREYCQSSMDDPLELPLPLRPPALRPNPPPPPPRCKALWPLPYIEERRTFSSCSRRACFSIFFCKRAREGLGVRVWITVSEEEVSSLAAEQKERFGAEATYSTDRPYGKRRGSSPSRRR